MESLIAEPGSRSETVLITGASGGIGCEFARLFARKGYDLVLVSRNEEALAKLALDLGTKYKRLVKVIPKDLGNPASPREIYIQLVKEAVKVDVLVNCAGSGVSGMFSETDLKSELAMIHVNVVALTELTKLFLKDMLDRREGKILNVASTAAYQPGPLMAVYYATKAYVLSFSEALSEEVGDTGVTVTALCPGPTRTDFQSRAGLTGSKLFSSSSLLRTAEPDTVAAAGYEGLMRGESVVIPGLRNAILARAVRILPRGMVAKVVRKMHEHAYSSLP